MEARKTRDANIIKLLIMSDIRLYREGLENILDKERCIEVVATVSDVESGISKNHKYSPDVILLDMAMLGSELTVDKISSSYPGVKIIAIAITNDEDSVLACAQAGIAGYVSRDELSRDIVETVCGVFKGEIHCPKHIAVSLFHKVKTLSSLNNTSTERTALYKSHSANDLLTRREKQKAALLHEGLSNKQVAQHLTKEVSTVKNHVHNILSKMGIHSRFKAVTVLRQ